MAVTKTKPGKCKTLAKGDVEIDGVEGVVFHRMYESHKRGPAIFFNNRRGGKLTVYTEQLSAYIDGKERKFKTEAAMNKAVVKVLNTVVENNSDDE